MMEADGPKRRESQELTAVIPRECLPPPSMKMLSTLDLDPEHPETAELNERAVERDDSDDWRTTPTLVPCPAGCPSCSCCRGNGLVTHEAATAWRTAQADAKSPHEDDQA